MCNAIPVQHYDLQHESCTSIVPNLQDRKSCLTGVAFGGLDMKNVTWHRNM